MTNVARHGGGHAGVGAPSVTDSGQLELDVEDHGRGALTLSAPRRGLGIVTMREPAALISAAPIEFTRPREGGTLVRVSVPLEN